MNAESANRIADLRAHRRRARRTFGIAALMGGLALVAYALWCRQALSDLAPPTERFDALAPRFVTGVSARIVSWYLSAAFGIALLSGGGYLLLGHDRTGLVLAALEETLDPERHAPVEPPRSPAQKAQSVLVASVLTGASLTVLTAGLDTFGGAAGETAAKLIGFPAILWSDLAYSLWLPGLVNGLLADPGGLFCFASPSERLTSHYLSSFPAFTVFTAVVLRVHSALRRRKVRKH